MKRLIRSNIGLLVFPLLLPLTLVTILASAIRPGYAAPIAVTGTPAIYALPAELAAGGALFFTGHDFAPGLDLDVSLMDGGGSVTALGVWQTDGNGLLSGTAVLPSLTPGGYTIIASDGNVTARAPLTIRPPLGFSFTPQAGSPGVVVDFTVTNLVTGRLRLDYDGAPVFGPTPVAAGSYTGSFVVPNDRPAVFDAAVALTAVNQASSHVIGQATGAFQAQSPPPSPAYQFNNVVVAGSDLAPGDVFTITGSILPGRGRAYARPFALSAAQAGQMQINVLWQEGGLTFPVTNGQSQIQMDGAFQVLGVVPSLLNGDMLSGGGSGGAQVGVVLQEKEFGPAALSTPIGMGSPPPFQVKVVDPQGQPIPNVIVNSFNWQHEPTSGQQPGGVYSFNVGDLATMNSQAANALNALGGGGDPFNCGDKAVYGRTDANGLFVSQYNPEILALTGKEFVVNWGGQAKQIYKPITMTFNLVVNGLYQGYGETDSSGKGQPYQREIMYSSISKRFYDAQTKQLLATVPLTVTLPPLPPSTQMEAPVQLQVPGAVLRQQYDDYLGSGIPAVAYGKFVSFADTAVFPDNIFSTAAPIRVQFRHNALDYGSLISATLTLDGQTTPFVVSGSGGNECAGASIYILDIPNSHRLAPGVHTGEVRVKDAAGFITRRTLLLTFVDAPQWIQDAGVSNRTVSIHTAADSSPYSVHLSADLLAANDPNSTSTLGADVPKVGQLDNSAGAESSFYQNMTAAGAEALLYSGAFRSSALNETAPNAPFPSVGGETAVTHPENAQVVTAVAAGSNAFDIPQQTITILDSGKMPLFRDVWGIWPIASATIGADIWFNATLTYKGTMNVNPASGAMSSSLFVDPEATVGVDAWLDVSALFGLVDANAHAIPQITVGMPVTFTNGVKDDSAICFRYKLDVKWHAQVGVCVDTPLGSTCLKESGSKNIFDDYTPKNQLCQPNQAALLQTANDPPPPAASPSIATDGFGHTLAVWRTSNGDIVGSLYNGVSQSPAVTITGNHASLGPQVAFYAPNQAVAVWAQSSLTAGQAATTNITDTLKAQYLAYALWDGTAWSAAQSLTAPATGEGGVVLAGCLSANPVCPAGGEVTAVWVRDAAGALAAHQFRLYAARFNNGGWSAPAPVDAGSTAADAEPTLAYQNGTAVVGWVRDGDRDFGTLADRRFAYALLDSGSPTINLPADLPTGLTEPALAVDDLGALKLAFTVAQDPQAFVGNQRTLYTAAQTCGRIGCTWAVQAMRDSHGRDIHAEGPQLAMDAQGGGIVTYRALGFGPTPGGQAQTFPEDSVGAVMGTGDMAQLHVDFLTSSHNPAYLTNDGAVNWQVTAVFEPVLNLVQAVSVQGATPTFPAAVVQRHGFTPDAGQQRVSADGQTVLFVTRAEQADFAVTAVTPSTPYPQNGQPFTVTVGLQNNGPAWSSGSGPMLDLLATWDGAPGVGAAAGLVQLEGMDAGQPVTVTMAVTLPANLDLPRTLFVTANPALTVGEVNLTNNQFSLDLAGLPAPGPITATLKTGSSLVFLAWPPLTDGRVVGYRVYRLDDLGNAVPVGNSPTNGFVDLTAVLDQSYTYAVTSFTNEGIESGFSPLLPIRAEPYRVFLPVISKAKAAFRFYASE